MQDNFINLPKNEQLNFIKELKPKTLIEGDLLEVEGNPVDIEILIGKNEMFFALFFTKNDVFNETTMILYDHFFNPYGKIAYSINDKDKRISFNYFFVRKDLRGQGLGQTMVDVFFDKMEEKFGSVQVFVNPYSFDTSFNGIKGYDYEQKLYQYRLERFYLENNFLLTEEPKKYTFSDIEYDESCYTLTVKPSKFNDYYNFKENNYFKTVK